MSPPHGIAALAYVLKSGMYSDLVMAIGEALGGGIFVSPRAI
jgi:hypothetical protein